MSSQASDETPTGSSNASQISKLSASPSPSEVASPTVLVVGGGVCGLVTGLALSSAGCEVHIYEQHDVQSSSASGDIAFLVTDELQQFLKSCDVPLWGKTFRTLGRQVLADDGDVQLRDSTEQEYISWNTLHSALLAAFPADHYHSSSKVVAVDDSHQEYVIMELDSGERIAGHMLVAADGMSSRVRAELLPNCQPSYSGYLAWRGICHLDRLTEGVQHLLADRASMYKGPNLHVLVHPLADCDGAGEGQPLSWTWFNNQLEEELSGLLLDEQLQAYTHAVPLGKLSSAVTDAVSAAAADALPEPLAELIACSAGSMSVAAVSDMALPCLTRANRVAFVGEAGCVIRPHGSSNLQKALLDATSLAEYLQSRKLVVEKALPAWEGQQVKQSIALCKAAAAAGNRLQGTEEC